MKAILLGALLMGVIGASVFVRMFTHHVISIWREYKGELDSNERYHMKIALIVLAGIDIIYIIGDIVLLKISWDLFKEVF